jgi:hypothetical protein
MTWKHASLLRLDKSHPLEIREELSLDINLNRNSRFENKYTFLYCVFQKAVRVRKQREMIKKREGRMNEKT